MADPFAAPDEPTAPATPPAPAITPEIEALIAQRVQALSDQRISGLQASFDKRFAAQDKELQRVRKQALGEPDEDPAEDSELARENAELKRRIAISEVASRYPKAGAVYQKLVSLDDVDEQVAYLEGLLTPPAPPAAPPPAQEPDEELDVPDIDPNRPAPTGAGYAVYDGVRMNDEIAKRILESATSWPTYNT